MIVGVLFPRETELEDEEHFDEESLWWLAGGFLVRTLSKYKCFLVRFDGLFTLRLTGSTRLARSTIHPAIHHREALVCRLGVEVISETKLVG